MYNNYTVGLYVNTDDGRHGFRKLLGDPLPGSLYCIAYWGRTCFEFGVHYFIIKCNYVL